MTENTNTATETVTETTTPKSTAILMARDHKKGGRGVTKMYVDPSQMADFIKAGWKRV